MPFGASTLPGLGYPSLVDGRAGGPPCALGRSHSAFSLMASFLVWPMTCKYRRWELATSQAWHHSDVCVLACASCRVGATGNPPLQPDKAGAVTEHRTGLGNTLEICLFLPSSSNFFFLCSFCHLLGKQAEGRRPIKHAFNNSLYFILILLHSCC